MPQTLNFGHMEVNPWCSTRHHWIYSNLSKVIRAGSIIFRGVGQCAQIDGVVPTCRQTRSTWTSFSSAGNLEVFSWMLKKLGPWLSSLINIVLFKQESLPYLIPIHCPSSSRPWQWYSCPIASLLPALLIGLRKGLIPVQLVTQEPVLVLRLGRIHFFLVICTHVPRPWPSGGMMRGEKDRETWSSHLSTELPHKCQSLARKGCLSFLWGPPA